MYFIHPFSFRRQIRVPYLKGGLTHRDRTSPCFAYPVSAHTCYHYLFLSTIQSSIDPIHLLAQFHPVKSFYAKQPPYLPWRQLPRYMIRDCPLKWGPAERIFKLCTVFFFWNLLTSFDVIWWHLMSFDVLRCHLVCCDVFRCPRMSSDVSWCFWMSFDLWVCHPYDNHV
jgi:hypothetical protein